MLTKQLSDYALALSFEDMSAGAVLAAKMSVEDLIGVALSGSAQPQGEIWRNHLLKNSCQDDVTVWQSSFPKTSYYQAAALNSAYGHILDMDDVHNTSVVHLGVVTIPAALALGMHLHLSS